MLLPTRSAFWPRKSSRSAACSPTHTHQATSIIWQARSTFIVPEAPGFPDCQAARLKIKMGIRGTLPIRRAHLPGSSSPASRGPPSTRRKAASSHIFPAWIYLPPPVPFQLAESRARLACLSLCLYQDPLLALGPANPYFL